MTARPNGDRDLFAQVITADKIKVVITTPEMIVNSKHWQELIKTRSLAKLVNYLAVDEAHCIPSWGTEFRPAYREMPAILSYLKRNTPIIAVSATVTANDETDIK